MKKKGEGKIPGFDKVIHERARLAILGYLASNEREEASFPVIREELSMTGGNLSVQLRNLGEAGYVSITKSFVENKPCTTVSITPKGRVALMKYVEEIEGLIKALRSKT